MGTLGLGFIKPASLKVEWNDWLKRGKGSGE
jgi:hypothetical protein